MSEPHRCSRMSCSISIGSDAKDVPPAVAPTRLVILGVEAPKLRGYGIGRSFAKERGCRCFLGGGILAGLPQQPLSWIAARVSRFFQQPRLTNSLKVSLGTRRRGANEAHTRSLTSAKMTPSTAA